MAASGQWEIVAKNPKKSRNANHQVNKLTKSQVKSYVDAMPRQEDLPPLKETPTIFDAFLSKEKKEEPKKQNSVVKEEKPIPVLKNNNQSKKVGQQKKKQQDKKKDLEKPANTLEEALAKINAEQLQNLMETVQLRFPDSAVIWLKELISFLNLTLTVPMSDPVYAGKPTDYPLCVVSPTVRRIMMNVFDKCPDAALQLFFEHLVTNMAHDMAKGTNLHGYRILIQALATKKPSLTTKNLSKFSDLREQYQNRHPICLSILWALGQGGFNDLVTGIKVWLEMMLPLLGMKAFSKYAIDYLDVLFNLHVDVKTCGDVLGPREFFPVMDLIFSHSANLQVNLHKQLLGLYPKLKTVAFGNKPDQKLRNYFPSFLVRLLPSSSPLLKNELQACLVMCLATDLQCYSVWRQLYTKHLVQSSLLLEHLVTEWENIKSGLPKKLLKETLGTFQVTNEELGNQGKNTQDGYLECVKHCEVVISKMSLSAMFPWRLLFVLVVTVVSGILLYDINLHGSFQASKSGRLLNDVGLLAVCEHGWTRTKTYSGKFYKWLEDNIPYYYASFVEIADPYVKLFWEKLYIVGAFLADLSKDLRLYLHRKVPGILQWINDHAPALLTKASLYIWDAWTYIKQFSLIIWSNTLYYSHHVGIWLQEYVFTGKLSPENLQRYTLDTVETVQQYTLAAYHWVSHQIGGTAAGK